MSPPAAGASRPSAKRSRLAGLVVVAVLLGGIAVYVWARPVLRERQLRGASVEDLQAMTARDPDDARALYYLGLRLQAGGRREEAAKILERAAGLSGDEQVFLAWANGVPYNQSIHILTYYLDRHPGSIASTTALARDYTRIHDYKRGLEQAQLVTKANPADAEGWQLLAESADALQRSVVAEGAYRQAEKLGRHNESLVIGLASTLIEQGKSHDAVNELKAGVQEFPNAGAVWLALGKALFQSATSRGDFVAARDALERAINLGTVTSTAYRLLGQTEIALGSVRESRYELDHAAVLDPFDPQIPYLQARVYRQLGDNASSAERTRLHDRLVVYQNERFAIIARLRRDPANSTLMIQIARLACRYGDYHSAAGYYRRLLADQPGDAKLAQEAARAIEHAGPQGH